MYHRTSLFDGGLSTPAAHAAAHAVPPQHVRIAVTPALIGALAALAAACACCGAAGTLRMPCCDSDDTPPETSTPASPAAESADIRGGACGECWDVWEEFVRVLCAEARHAEGIVWTKRGLQGHEGAGLQPGGGDLYEEAAVPAGVCPPLAAAGPSSCIGMQLVEAAACG